MKRVKGRYAILRTKMDPAARRRCRQAINAFKGKVPLIIIFNDYYNSSQTYK